jgi:hypothetical protein
MGQDGSCEAPMTLIGLIVTLVVVGALLYVVQSVLPIAPQIKTLITIVVVLAVCIWLLQVFGLLGGGPVLGRPIR